MKNKFLILLLILWTAFMASAEMVRIDGKWYILNPSSGAYVPTMCEYHSVSDNNISTTPNLCNGWNFDLQIGAGAFFGSPLGCGSTLSRVKPAFRAHIGKWLTPSVGSRLSWEGATMQAADMVTQRYQAFHMDILWNLAPMFSAGDNFTLSPYLGTGCVWNQTIGHAPMALSYGVAATAKVSKNLSAIVEFGGMSTFKYFDGITCHGREPECCYHYPRLGDHIWNLTVGLSYTIPSRKKSKSTSPSYNDPYRVDNCAIKSEGHPRDNSQNQASSGQSENENRPLSRYDLATDKAKGDTYLDQLYTTEQLLALVEQNNQAKKSQDHTSVETSPIYKESSSAVAQNSCSSNQPLNAYNALSRLLDENDKTSVPQESKTSANNTLTTLPLEKETTGSTESNPYEGKNTSTTATSLNPEKETWPEIGTETVQVMEQNSPEVKYENEYGRPENGAYYLIEDNGCDSNIRQSSKDNLPGSKANPSDTPQSGTLSTTDSSVKEVANPIKGYNSMEPKEIKDKDDTSETQQSGTLSTGDFCNCSVGHDCDSCPLCKSHRDSKTTVLGERFYMRGELGRELVEAFNIMKWNNLEVEDLVELAEVNPKYLKEGKKRTSEDVRAWELNDLYLWASRKLLEVFKIEDEFSTEPYIWFNDTALFRREAPQLNPEPERTQKDNPISNVGNNGSGSNNSYSQGGTQTTAEFNHLKTVTGTANSNIESDNTNNTNTGSSDSNSNTTTNTTNSDGCTEKEDVPKKTPKKTGEAHFNIIWFKERKPKDTSTYYYNY